MAENTNLSPEDKMIKATQGDKQKKEALEEILAHLDGIMDDADRMTSGNFMHHRAAIKLSAKIVKDRVVFLNSKQEVPSNNSINFEEELYKAFGQVKDFSLGMRIAARFYDMGRFDAHIQNNDHVVYNEDLGCRVNLSQLKRVVKKDPRYCMYSKDNYTDEDRKVLCVGCMEECKFNHTAKICGWVARQPEGDLWLFAEPPYYNSSIGSWGTAIGGERELEGIDTTMFKDLNYYDEPIEVELIIRKS